MDDHRLSSPSLFFSRASEVKSREFKSRSSFFSVPEHSVSHPKRTPSHSSGVRYGYSDDMDLPHTSGSLTSSSSPSQSESLVQTQADPPLLPMDHPATSGSQRYRVLRKSAFKTLGFLTLSLRMLSVYFTYQAMQRLLASTRDHSSEDLAQAQWFWSLAQAAIGLVTAAVLIADLSGINPQRRTEERFSDHNPLETKAVARHPKATTYLRKINKSLAFPVYLIYTLPEVNSFMKLFLTEAQAEDPYYFSGSALSILMLGIPYSYFFSYKMFGLHAERWVDFFADFPQNLPKLCQASWRQWLMAGEVCLQALSNALYRGVWNQYVLEQFLETIGDERGDAWKVLFSSRIFWGLTLYTVLATRSLLPQYAYFNPEFAQLTAEEIGEVRLSRFEIAIEAFWALCRGFALGGLIFHHYHPASEVQRFFVATAPAAALTLHKFYVDYYRVLYHAALLSKKMAQLNRYSSDRLRNWNSLSSAMLFDQVADTFKTPSLKKTIKYINYLARVGRVCSTGGGLITLLTHRHLLAKPIDFIDEVGLIAAIMLTTLGPDALLSQQRMEESWSDYKLRWRLGSFFTDRSHFSKQSLLAAASLPELEDFQGNAEENEDEDQAGYRQL